MFRSLIKTLPKAVRMCSTAPVPTTVHSAAISVLGPLKPSHYLSAVTQNGEFLQLIQHQTPILAKAAVSQNGWALQYVHDKTPAICRAAVRNYWKALQFVPGPEDIGTTLYHDICLDAVRQAGRALKLAKMQTEALCLAAVQQDGMALAHVHDQTPSICIAAMQQNRTSIWYVKKGVIAIDFHGGSACGSGAMVHVGS